MERAVNRVSQLGIGRHRQKNIRCLDRNLEFVEIVILQDTRMIERGFNQRLGAGFSVFFKQVTFQRSGIDPDPHGTAMITGRLDDLTNTVG